MQVIIKIKCDNAAFYLDDDYAPEVELSSIFERLAYKMKHHEVFTQRILDTNGNYVGDMEIIHAQKTQ